MPRHAIRAARITCAALLLTAPAAADPPRDTSSAGPTISLSAGHFFPGDINGLLRALATGDYSHDPRLEHFDYDFASLHLGWETECAGVLLFLRGGASVLWTELPATTTASSEPYWLLLPSLRIGFIGFL